jgi:catechol 2,3-dioxygenase-like lactoylglutathione lyase family enzyme
VFDHVTIRVADREASRRFYDTVLAPLGHERRPIGEIFDEWGDYSIAQAGAAQEGSTPATAGLHVAFTTTSREEVDAFWQAGVDAGYESDGDPGLRPIYHDDYYGAFLLDPDGNSVEAVFHGQPREAGSSIDHLWLRVSDLDRATAFWDAVAPQLGLGVRRSDRAPRVHVEKADRSFALLAGDRPTSNLHVAFPAPDDETVRAFHQTAIDAGYRDNGAPGERPIYHPGYYGAFVLDPDGNNIEAVNHNR